MIQKQIENNILITAGSTYLDIDAYACMVSMAELLKLQGKNAVAYSKAPCNYSVSSFLTEEKMILRHIPDDIYKKNAKYVIVDVSDPEFLKDSVPLDCVIEIYDHHVGFEDYWHGKIGECSHIEFIGAAVTLIYREWCRAGLQNKISRSTTLLMIAAILDNTLNLTSLNTTEEDIKAFHELCDSVGVSDEFRTLYFSEVQKSVEYDLKNALFGDIKTVRNNMILPTQVAQLCVWDAESILNQLSKIRSWFNDESWMINIIDISKNRSIFVCENEYHQKQIERVFDVHFKDNVAKTKAPYLRKQIIKNTLKYV